MAGCCGGPTCACKIVGGDSGITVTGTGTVNDPYVLDGQGGTEGPPGDIGDAINLGTIAAGALDLNGYTLATQTFRGVLGGAVTLTATDMPVPPAGKTGSFSLRLAQATPAVGSLAPDATIKKSYGVVPTSTATSAAVDVWHFMWTGIEWVCAGLIADIR